jgi:hypothetical protein
MPSRTLAHKDQSSSRKARRILLDFREIQTKSFEKRERERERKGGGGGQMKILEQGINLLRRKHLRERGESLWCVPGHKEETQKKREE